MVPEERRSGGRGSVNCVGERQMGSCVLVLPLVSSCYTLEDIFVPLRLRPDLSFDLAGVLRRHSPRPCRTCW